MKKITVEEIPEAIDRWYESDVACTVYEFLGISKSQYLNWLDFGTFNEPSIISKIK